MSLPRWQEGDPVPCVWVLLSGGCLEPSVPDFVHPGPGHIDREFKMQLISPRNPNMDGPRRGRNATDAERVHTRETRSSMGGVVGGSRRGFSDTGLRPQASVLRPVDPWASTNKLACLVETHSSNSAQGRRRDGLQRRSPGDHRQLPLGNYKQAVLPVWLRAPARRSQPSASIQPLANPSFLIFSIVFQLRNKQHGRSPRLAPR